MALGDEYRTYQAMSDNAPDPAAQVHAIQALASAIMCLAQVVEDGHRSLNAGLWGIADAITKTHGE